MYLHRGLYIRNYCYILGKHPLHKGTEGPLGKGTDSKILNPKTLNPEPLDHILIYI